jgi:hypothetical protein
MAESKDGAMPDLSPTARLDPVYVALADGRQSRAAAAIQRGVRRLYASLGAVSVTELTLVSGRRADVAVLRPDGSIDIVEIKSCLDDFRVDRKWPDYRDFCDRLLFAVNAEFPHGHIPREAGLIVADEYGAAIAREPVCHPLAPARRRAMTLRFARAAAAKLHALSDPEGARGAIDSSTIPKSV